MGGCASMPKDLKCEAEAPEELPAANTIETVKSDEAAPIIEAKTETSESTENNTEEPKAEETAAEPKVNEEEGEETVASKISDEENQEKPKEEASDAVSEEVVATLKDAAKGVATEDKATEKKEEVVAHSN